MNDILQSYLEDNIKVNPPMNDFFLYDKFLNIKHIQPDIYSEKYSLVNVKGTDPQITSVMDQFNDFWVDEE